jgi:hypothetical protein
VPLDDEFTVALERVDDRGSTRTRSSKGKRPADRDRDRDKGLSRTVSRTTISTTNTPEEFKGDSSAAVSPTGETAQIPSLQDLRWEEEQAEREEHEEIERRRKAAFHLAIQRGLTKDELDAAEALDETKDDSLGREHQHPPAEESPPHVHETTTGDEEADEQKPPPPTPPESASSTAKKMNGESRSEGTFVPARLPHFG